MSDSRRRVRGVVRGVVRGFNGGTAGRSVQYCPHLISLGICQYLARRELCRLLWRDGKGLDWVESGGAARYNSDQVQRRKWIWACYFFQTLMAIFITSLVIFDERELKIGFGSSGVWGFVRPVRPKSRKCNW